MKKLIFLFLLFCGVLSAQKVDTVIVTPIYTSYYSYQTRTPLFVVYDLYKGGGKVSRKGMTFKTGGLKQSGTERDYRATGYDIGHQMPAEAAAYSATAEQSTFFFYNSLPQTARLNRGTWKSLEEKVLKQSQTNHLRVICGGFGFNKKIGTVSVPSFCFKIIKNKDTGDTKAYLFPNNNSDSFTEISLGDLLNKIPNIKDQINNNLK